MVEPVNKFLGNLRDLAFPPPDDVGSGLVVFRSFSLVRTFALTAMFLARLGLPKWFKAPVLKF
jgi:hypothetical protein